MKKIIALLTAGLVLVAALSGCAGENSAEYGRCGNAADADGCADALLKI